ncbi:MAG: metalloregulator ArsR/SmtB family transcription factor [Pseudomonadota bacterium]
MNDQNAANAFASLGHSNRVSILRLLVQAGQDGLNVSHMRETLELPATTFGHHLKALVDAGLVQQEKQGRELISRADYCAIQRLTAFLMEDCCKGAFTNSFSQTDALEPS